MPYFYRRYPYRRSYWRRGGVGAAQKQGTRRFKLLIPVEGTASVPVPANRNYSYVCGFEPYYASTAASDSNPDRYSQFGNVVTTPLFQTYCKLYDEVKLNSVRLAVAVVKLPSGVSGFKAVTAIDRHCTIDDIYVRRPATQLMGSAECQTKMFTSLDYAKLFRRFYARDLQEKSIFIDSTIGQQDVPSSGGIPAITRTGIKEFLDAGSCYSAFNPMIDVGFVFANGPTADDVVVMQYTIQYEFVFRNPKFAISSVSKGLDFDTKVVEEEKSDEMEEEKPVLKKKKVVIEEEDDDDDDDELNPLLDESQEPFTAPKMVTVKKAGKKS